VPREESRIAAVTGGSGGIGAAICRGLAADGMRVAVLDLDLNGAKATAKSLNGNGHAGFAINVSDETDVERVFGEVEKVLGRISVLILGAGVLLLRPDGSRNLIEKTDLSEWSKTQDVNSTGAFLCAREYIRRLPAEAPRTSPANRQSSASPRRWRASSRRAASPSIRWRLALLTRRCCGSRSIRLTTPTRPRKSRSVGWEPPTTSLRRFDTSSRLGRPMSQASRSTSTAAIECNNAMKP
jgi:NAD(P)-dependent dehydrogenase (short-subunit alcohol dehydrogenase family)